MPESHFPVNFEKFLNTFLQNNSGGLLLCLDQIDHVIGKNEMLSDVGRVGGLASLLNA